jgi:hypothetical protein
MNDEIKEYINEEIGKSDLRLAAESERIQRIVSESRFRFYIKLLSALGAAIAIGLPVILALILSSQNRAEFDRMEQKIEKQSVEVSQRLDQKGSALEQRLDSAIASMSSEMRRTANELSRSQVKPPRFSATVNGKPLDGQLVELSPNSSNFTAVIMNTGEGTARNIGLSLYCSDSIFFGERIGSDNYVWNRLPFVDEPLFKAEYKMQPAQSQNIILSPQEPFAFSLWIEPDAREITTTTMLKVTYEQGIPKKFFFKIRYKK